MAIIDGDRYIKNTNDTTINSRNSRKEMIETQTDKASLKANIIEQRLFEKTLSSMNTLKHATLVKLSKSQNVMKKRLRKYRDKQREIFRSREGYDKDPIDEFFARHLTNRPTTKQNGRSIPVSSRSPFSARVSRGKKRETPPHFGCSSDSEPDIELDGLFMIDHQKTKIDLRPKMALDIKRKGSTKCTIESYLNYGRPGAQMRQVKYLDDDELKEREHFYRYLVEKRINIERRKIDQLDARVAIFCGNGTIQTLTKKIHSK